MKMKKLYIRIFTMLTLLLLGGMAGEAWGKITYHILSLPMTTYQRDGTRNIEGSTVATFQTNVRVEVLRCVSSDLHVNLPFEYRSPLATNYRYYSAEYIAQTGPSQLYGYNNTTYYFYNIKDKDGNYTSNNADYGDDTTGNDNTPLEEAVRDGVRLTPGDACGDNIHIYVTYDVKASPDIDLSTLFNCETREFSSSKKYNIHLKDRMLVLNQNRQNRPGAVLDGYYSPEDLARDDFSWIVKEGLNGAQGYRHFTFRFGGNDPYNVTIFSAFDKPYTYRGKGQNDFNTTFYKDKDKYLQKDVYKEYRGSSFFSLMAQEITANMWLSSEADIQWQEGGSADNASGKWVPGYFKGPNDNKSTYYEMSPVFNSFAILNHKSGVGYAFAGSKMNTGENNWQPSASGQIQYLDYNGNGNNITIIFKADASVMKVDVYEVKKYIFRVVTPFGSNVDAEMEWSDYSKDETITASLVPESLKRKYTNFTGNFYTNAAHTTPVTTFAAAQAKCTQEGEKYVIYVDYSVSNNIPFTAITAENQTSGYSTATWYELTDAASDGGNKIKWNSTAFQNNGASGVYDKESEFAFIGDPYELRVINRALTVSNSDNRYVGCEDPANSVNLGESATDGIHYKWEIPYDNTTGSFTLRELGSTNAYWYWDASSSGNYIQYSTTASTRIKLMEIGKQTYTFNVVDLAGNIAIQGTADLTPFTSLDGNVEYSMIPAAIRSPFLADETVTFYDSYTDRNSDGNINRSDWHNPSEQTALTELPGVGGDIYVAYTTTYLSNKNIKLIYNEQFNVKLNGEYIYWNSSDNKILSKAEAELTSGELGENAYLWHLRGRDPYSMRIDNVGYSATLGSPLPDITVTIYDTAGNGVSHTESVKNGMFVSVDGGTWGDDKALTWTSNRDNASCFVAMMSNNVGVYEVLAATGSADYYHIGRASTAGAETKIYSDATYAHGADQLRFELAGVELITYHLIDKSGNEIFTDEITSKNPRLALPSDYVSPLVEEYYYYPTRAKAATDLPADRITEIIDDTNESGGARDDHVYVTYKVGDDIGFGKDHPHLLKFLDPLDEGYYLEDGSDKLTSEKIKAIYPYCNGDGSLNIYGKVMRDEQMDGGSSTRPRWVWYFESTNNDPYHVKIHSKSTISFGGRSNETYLQTFAVHFNQDTDAPNKQRIVTGCNLIGITQDVATEYAIMGRTGHYKLLTINPVKADLNGDGDTDDTVDGIKENDRRTVTSFEQYWKTYNMIRLHVLGLAKPTEDDFTDDPSTFTVPTTPASYRETIEARGWHSYDAVVNATRWNGFNDVEGKSGLEKKKVERLEHWFQTFDMGDGTFDIEDANIPAVLVLLDRHGWEIMRRPIPVGDGDADPSAGEKLADLMAFDSPMVKEYKFYSNANKASGCHRYTLRMQNGAERDPIKVNGTHFTSTSLGTLPPYVADRDLFVTYTVKDEYEKSYDESTQTPSSTFIVLQNHQYAWDDGSGFNIDATTAPASLSETIIADADLAEGSKTFKQNTLWYLQPNSYIDTEMGYPGATAVTYTDAENDFDPYNMQIRNASTNKYFTIDMTKSVLSGGVYTGDYTGRTLDVTLSAANTTPVSSPESYDHSTLKMTNQTFMAVQDANGNMQLMPRFDHSRRINAFATLAAPQTHAKAAVDDASPGVQTTFMVRPQVLDYHIIDNQGNVAMRYKMAGEYYPSIPEHFKSPLAMNFRFYKTLDDANSDGVYEIETLADEITGSFATADITDDKADIFVRYDYDETHDSDNDNILRGRWMTMQLGGSTAQDYAQYSGTLNAGGGIYGDAATPTKPATINSDAKEWQWKFLQSPCVSTSPYYVAPDPYAVRIFNREANNGDPQAENSPMSIPIKVGTADRFVLLAHPDGGYALAAAGSSLSYSFLSGASMTEPSTTPASIVAEAGFTKTSNIISAGAQVILRNEVTHQYTYNIITNGNLLAAYDTQSDITAAGYSYIPVLPATIQSPLINLDDYLYYGTATQSGSEYTVDTNSQIDGLYGLYDDVVYVRYPAFSRDNTPYMVPNDRNDTSPVAVGPKSNDVAIDLSGNLPYNIIWESDYMMRSSDGTNIDGSDIDGSYNGHKLSATSNDMWHFTGNDPYAIVIKRDGSDKHVDGTPTLSDNATPQTFMLLKREGYDFGVLAKTGDKETFLSGHGETTVTGGDAPTKFIPFALSVYHLIYHLVINNIGSSTDIPYRAGKEGDYSTTDTWQVSDVKTIDGTTQRDLAVDYQLGETVNGQNYSHDAGKVSIGDELETPSILSRPNCKYYYYVEGIYTDVDCEPEHADATMNAKYKGLEITDLMSDAQLIGKTVRVNVAYSFNTDLVDTNAGEGFVTSVGDNLWYTFETSDATPYLAHYTNAWGLQSMAGRATRYTNDYLWTPVGDAYGFVMYNRYMILNSGSNTVMTADINENKKLSMNGKDANAVFELLAKETTTPGYFLIHPVVNKSGDQYYLKRHDVDSDIDNDGNSDLNYTVFSTTPSEWTFGLTPELIQPYLERVGYVGGLKQTVYDGMDAALVSAINNGTATTAQLMTAQKIVYNTENIVSFASGYYRLHNQPGVSGINPVRYASGYLHNIEQTAGEGGTAIPMHFYSRKNVSTTFEDEGGLMSGFTKTSATQGPIPVLATEYDPSTIFYLNGSVSGNSTISTATMQTQGLYVRGDQTDVDHGDATMTATTGGSGETTTFTLMDIGGAVFLIHDGSEPANRKYFNFSQSYEKNSVNMIYDLKFFHNSPTDDAKWCIEPANTQGLLLATNDGGDGFFYATFYAPFDVVLPANSGSNNYYAYYCTKWNTETTDPRIYPKRVPESGTYAEGKFVPAGTPVIIRTTNNTGNIKLTLPPSSSPTALTEPLSSCVFSGTYLEQLLASEIAADDKVYTFGLPITGYGVKITSGDDNGEITDVVNRNQADTGVGFFLNANPNKELGNNSGLWTPNNRYVLHNRIYYRGAATVSSSRLDTRGEVQFIPVIFDADEEQPGDGQTTANGLPVDNRIYDLQGRCVATEQQVMDGTWRTQLSRGIYILNGRKFRKQQ